MISYAIDTNALISFLTDRNKFQRERIARFIEKASKLECEIFIIDNVIAEMVYVFISVYRQDTMKIREILISIDKNPGIQVLAWVDMLSLLSIWPEKIKDFGDAVLASFALQNGLKILPFDKSFQRQLKKLSIGFLQP